MPEETEYGTDAETQSLAPTSGPPNKKARRLAAKAEMSKQAGNTSENDDELSTQEVPSDQPQTNDPKEFTFSGNYYEIDDFLLSRVTRLLGSVSDPTRLKIFQLCDGTRPVKEICKLLNKGQPSVSHHLGLLIGNELISPIRTGRFNAYKWTPNGEILMAASKTVVDRALRQGY